MSTELIKHSENGASAEGRDALYMLGGMALMLVGAGLVLQNPSVRRLLGQVSGAGNLLEAAMPDVERYLKIRSM